MNRDEQKRVVDALVSEYGLTYAEEAGIRLTDTPQPLYRLLVLALLLSARIRAAVAVAAARELHEDHLDSPRRMADADWQRRVDALGRGGYRRYDERTATLPRSPSGTGVPPVAPTPHSLRCARRRRRAADRALGRRPAPAARGGGRRHR